MSEKSSPVKAPHCERSKYLAWQRGWPRIARGSIGSQIPRQLVPLTVVLLPQTLFKALSWGTFPSSWIALSAWPQWERMHTVSQRHDVPGWGSHPRGGEGRGYGKCERVTGRGQWTGCKVNKKKPKIQRNHLYGQESTKVFSGLWMNRFHQHYFSLDVLERFFFLNIKNAYILI